MEERSGQDLALMYWMYGVALAHILRFAVFDDPIGRQVVAFGGFLVYTLAATQADVGRFRLAGLIATVFPVIGLSTVLLTGAEVDHWQAAVGVTQAAAMLYVVDKAIRERVWAR